MVCSSAPPRPLRGAAHIGGQARVNCVNLSKLFLTPKSDFTWLNQECAALNKNIKIGSVTRGFCKTFRNCWDLLVCIWCKKVYTRLILVCTGQYLVYSWFAHLEKHASDAVNLSMNKLGLNLLVISGALKILHASKLLRQHHCDHRQFTQSLTKVYTNQENKVYTKFTQFYFSTFTQSLHTVYTPYPSM